MREVSTELKALRLHGMVQAWNELSEPGKDSRGGVTLADRVPIAGGDNRSRYALGQSLRYTAKFPIHRDLAGFDFDVSPARSQSDRATGPADLHRAGAQRCIGWGTGTGKTHLATASAWRALPATASGCAFTPPWIWSTRWSERSTRQSRTHCHELAAHGCWSFSMSWVTCQGRWARGRFAYLSRLYEPTLVCSSPPIWTSPNGSSVFVAIRHRGNCIARSAHAPLPHCGDRQRLSALPAQPRR